MFKKLLCLIVLSGSASAIFAQPYIDANVGINTSWNQLGLNLNGGYMFSKYLGAEGGFTYSPGYTYNWGPYSYSSSYSMIDIAAKGVLPLTSIFAVYGKAGLGFNTYSGNWNCEGRYGCNNPSYYGSNTGLFIAVGGQFNLSKQWSLHVEDYTVTGPNPNFLVFGAQYNF